ncbi:MAG: RhuM family protein, partial [Clostridia bacterium]
IKNPQPVRGCGFFELVRQERASEEIPMSMQDWAARLDGFLEFNGRELLIGPSKISAEQAKLHAETEFEKYRFIQDKFFESDFDRFFAKSENAIR